jgi:SAM-dependent methyltransferase
MRRDWDKRASEDHQFYIASGSAASEEEFRASGERELLDPILDGIELDPSSRALEIGCGVGRLLAPLSMRTAEALGVDISPLMIEKSEEFLRDFPKARAWVTDGTLSGVDDGSLDFVFSYIVFQHIPVVEPILTYVQEAGRVLAPGGVLRFQVDGRGASPWGQDAGTYDGKKFTTQEARSLLDGTGLSIVDEWGEGTHYCWITAQKPGEGRVRLRRRVIDRRAVEDVLRALGRAEAGALAFRVDRGLMPLRDALGSLESLCEAPSNEEFVRLSYRRLTGLGPSSETLAFQTGILDKGFETRLTLLEAVLSCSEFRNLVRPFLVEVPWFVTEGLAAWFPSVSGKEKSTEISFAVCLDGEGLDEEIFLERVFAGAAGHGPDEEARQHYMRPIREHQSGRAVFVRDLLADVSGPEAAFPVSENRREALLSCLGLPVTVSDLRAGEGFPGEALAARALLESSAEASPEDFVEAAYLSILARPADAEGAAYWAAKVAAKEINRPRFLRELLRSGEFRQP